MKKLQNLAYRVYQSGKNKAAAAGAAVALSVTSAHAEVPTNVSTAITTAGTDAATVGGLVLVAVIGIYAVKFIRRAL